MKRVGRPRLDEKSPTVKFSIYLSTKRLDELCREAHHAQISVPELIRRKIQPKKTV